MFSDLNKLLKRFIGKKNVSTETPHISEKKTSDVRPAVRETPADNACVGSKPPQAPANAKKATTATNRRAGTASSPAASARTKHGIPLLAKDSNLFDDFGIEPPREHAETIPNKKIVKTAQPARKKKRPKKKNRSSQVSSRRRNKNGLPVFSAHDDLTQLFETLDKDGNSRKRAADPHEKQPVTAAHRKLSSASGDENGRRGSFPANRHGLPLLNDDTSFSRLFNTQTADPALTAGAAKDSTAPPARKHRENFARMLEESLTGKNTTALLKEKKDNLYSRKPLSVKQRIKRYPAPQGQLDLHGYTAIQAERKTADYISNAYDQGIFTVRIIVGKGLHSEDGPVLPDVVEDKLVALKNDQLVLAYQWEEKRKSRSGAVIVYLAAYD